MIANLVSWPLRWLVGWATGAELSWHGWGFWLASRADVTAYGRTVPRALEALRAAETAIACTHVRCEAQAAYARAIEERDQALTFGWVRRGQS